MLGSLKKIFGASFIGNASYIYQKLIGNISIKGSGNSIVHKQGALLWNTKIKIKGNNNNITLYPGCSLKNVTLTILGNHSEITIGEGVKFYERGAMLIEGSNGYIKVGKKTTFGEVKIFVGEGNTGITIGEDCMFSRDVAMNTSDFHSIINVQDNKRVNPPKNISIGNHVWVGNGSYVAKGAAIGNDCIIASRAYVNGKDYNSNTVIAGIPAKELKTGVTWSREKLPY